MLSKTTDRAKEGVQMEEKVNQRVMLSKRLLKESLIRQLKEESIYKISVRELCEQAGINRTTFYKYYGSPFDLLKDIEDDLLRSVQETLMEDGTDRAESLTRVCTYLEENIELSRMLINNNIDPQFPERLFHMPYIRGEIAKVLAARYSAEELGYASCFLTYGCYHMVKQWINRDGHEPPERIASLLLELIEGLA